MGVVSQSIWTYAKSGFIDEHQRIEKKLPNGITVMGVKVSLVCSNSTVFLRVYIFSQYGEVINSINPRLLYAPLAKITTDSGNGVSSLCQAIAWTNFAL